MSLFRQRTAGGAGIPTPASPPNQGGALLVRNEPAVAAVSTRSSSSLDDLKWWILERIEADWDRNVLPTRNDESQAFVGRMFDQLLAESGSVLSAADHQKLQKAIEDETIGYGPIEELLRDETCTEIMVNGPDLTYAERKGKLIETDIKFRDDEHVMKVINRILAPLGRRVDRKWPMVDARLPDGSRVNAIIPPCALNGPTITIRKFSSKPLQVADLIRFGSLTEQLAKFLEACVVGRLNIVVAGGTGSGKTTLLNVLSSFIPDDERIVTIEDAAEIQLMQRHVVTLEAKPADPDGSGRVTIRDLVINSLRMRPERIVIGECRGGEALDMLQAMNTGHDGSLTTTHANTPRDTIARLETLSMMSGMDLPINVLRAQIASAIHLIVQQARLKDGSRKVTYVTEVQGMEGDTVVLQDVFKFVEHGVDPTTGKVIGQMVATGIRPKFMEDLQNHGIFIDASVFDPGRPF
ncbi:MAG TPA: CpaF family protein [Dehalococcoidia bacterium]|nr:CpaF family protein [Dehalococcoidia bacterium]